MANDIRVADAGANGMANALRDLMNAGKLLIYDGTRPATADDAVTTQTLLVTFTFGDPCAADATAGSLTFNSVANANASASGSASWGRVTQSDDTVLYDGSVGTSGCDFNLSSVGITAGVEIVVTGITVGVPKT